MEAVAARSQSNQDRGREAYPVSGENESVAMWREVARVLPAKAPGRYTPAAALQDISLMEAIEVSLRDARRAVVRGT